MRFRVFAVFAFLLVAGCGEKATEAGSSGPVATTAEATTTTSAVSAAQLAAAAAIGNIAAGEEFFNRPLEGIPHSVSCSSCHSLDPTNTHWAPTVAGISAVAAGRVDGMSDADYLRQSIIDPYAFQVEGEWASAAMPFQYADVLSDGQINDLIAFLLTR